MSGVCTKMRGRSEASILEIATHLKRELYDAELICDSSHRIDFVNVHVLTFEKYYFRNGSYASLTVVLTENGDEKTADIIGSGGGEGLFNISWGANSSFAREAENVLNSYGLDIV